MYMSVHRGHQNVGGESGKRYKRLSTWISATLGNSKIPAGDCHSDRDRFTPNVKEFLGTERVENFCPRPRLSTVSSWLGCGRNKADKFKPSTRIRVDS